MKSKLKLFVAVLFLMGLLLAVFLVRNSNRKPVVHPPATPHKQEAVERVPVAVPETVGESFTTNESPVTDSRSIAAVRETPQTSAVPTGITFTPGALNVERPVLLPLVGAVSNAVLSVDRILKTRDYRVNEFSRSIWLTSEDKSHSIVWTIFPYRTNNIVGSVEATAYRDTAFQQKDPSRSFRMSFYPESGELREFCWADSREVLFVYTNGPFSVDYARHIEGSLSLEMRWDAKGNLASSNVYNWATRGRVIGGASHTNRPAYRFGPTSAVEAATESWRRKGE